MRKNNIIAAVAAFTLALTACQNDDNLTGDNTGKTPIELNFSVADGKAEINNHSEGSPTRAASTRATGSAFEVADKVGVFFAAKDATTLTGLATDRANHLYTLGDKGWTTTPLYWDDLGSATSLDLYGYYPQAATAPLNKAGNGISWTSPTDQSTAAKLTAADLLLSNDVKAYTKAATSTPTLTFTHAMAKLRINLVDNSTDTDAYTKAELAAAKATIKGLNTKCEVAFVGTAKTVSGASTPTDITPMEATAADATQASSFEAIVVPQKVTASALLAAITITSNKTDRTYSVKADASGFDLQQGMLNTLTVTITKSDVKVNMTVTDWGTGTSENKAVVIDGITTGTAGTNDLVATAGDVMQLFYIPGADKANISTTYTYGSDSKWKADAELYWDAIALTSYSKTFAASYTPVATAIAPAKTTPEKDLLEAATTIAYGSPINLAFTHAMAQLKIDLKAGTGFSDDADLITKTTSKKLTVQTSTAQTFTPATSKWSLTLGAAAARDFASGTTYTLAPQTLTDASTIVLTIANGNTYTVKLKDIMTTNGGTTPVFTAGKIAAAQSYTLTLTVNETGVGVNATVTDWTDITGSGDMGSDN